MKRIMAGLLPILLFLAGCASPNPDIDVYVLTITTLTSDAEPGLHHFSCEFTGYAAGKVVTYTDDGKVLPRQTFITDETDRETGKKRINIVKWGDVHVIDVYCTMIGRQGHSLHCLIASTDGKIVPMEIINDYAFVENGVSASCSMKIHVIS